MLKQDGFRIPKICKMKPFIISCIRRCHLSHFINHEVSSICQVHITYSFSCRTISSSSICLSPSTVDAMVTERQNEARKSVLIQVESKAAFPSLHKVCVKYGHISNAFHFIGKKKDVVLIEYANEDSVRKLMKQVNETGHSLTIVQGRSLKFSSEENSQNENEPTSMLLQCLECNDPIKIAQLLQECTSVSRQLTVLHQYEKMDELGTRLRYMICSLLEEALCGFVPSCRVLPFGSSLNGFGRNSSDLDMVIDFGNWENTRNKGDRPNIQRFVNVLGDVFRVFFPSFSNILTIAHARVPIVKFHHKVADIECDLSFSQLSGFYISELIYVLGHVDNRLYPLVFTIKKWAEVNEITNRNPGKWISNFSLSLLVIFFLQNRTPAVLPTIEALKSMASTDDIRTTIDGLDCTFLRDVTQIPVSENKENLETLLMKFFNFYGDFDFNKRAVSIVTGKHFANPKGLFYIENPIETELNVGRNVSNMEVERFQATSRVAAAKLSERSSNMTSVLSLLYSNYHPQVKKLMSKKFSVKNLFVEENYSEPTVIEQEDKLEENKHFIEPKIEKNASKPELPPELQGFKVSRNLIDYSSNTPTKPSKQKRLKIADVKLGSTNTRKSDKNKPRRTKPRDLFDNW